jgi:hypothetical protein
VRGNRTLDRLQHANRSALTGRVAEASRNAENQGCDSAGEQPVQRSVSAHCLARKKPDKAAVALFRLSHVLLRPGQPVSAARCLSSVFRDSMNLPLRFGKRRTVSAQQYVACGWSA